MKRAMIVAALVVVAALPLAARDRLTRDSYILNFGGTHSLIISGAFDNMREIKAEYGNEFLWARRGGQGYIITDRALLATAYDYFAPQRALRPEQKAVEQEMQKLEKESDALSDMDDRALTSAEKARLEDLHRQERELSRRERELDQREEELEKAAEKKLWQLVDGAIRSGAARPVR